MPESLHKVGKGFADDNISYLSGAGNPNKGEKGESEDTNDANIGSEYSDIETGDKWMKTQTVWRKLAFEG